MPGELHSAENISSSCPAAETSNEQAKSCAAGVKPLIGPDKVTEDLAVSGEPRSESRKASDDIEDLVARQNGTCCSPNPSKGPSGEDINHSLDSARRRPTPRTPRGSTLVASEVASEVAAKDTKPKALPICATTAAGSSSPVRIAAEAKSVDGAGAQLEKFESFEQTSEPCGDDNSSADAENCEAFLDVSQQLEKMLVTQEAEADGAKAADGDFQAAEDDAITLATRGRLGTDAEASSNASGLSVGGTGQRLPNTAFDLQEEIGDSALACGGKAPVALEDESCGSRAGLSRRNSELSDASQKFSSSSHRRHQRGSNLSANMSTGARVGLRHTTAENAAVVDDEAAGGASVGFNVDRQDGVQTNGGRHLESLHSRPSSTASCAGRRRVGCRSARASRLNLTSQAATGGAYFPPLEGVCHNLSAAGGGLLSSLSSTLQEAWPPSKKLLSGLSSPRLSRQFLVGGSQLVWPQATSSSSNESNRDPRRADRTSNNSLSHQNAVYLISYSFNQDTSCFICSTTAGFRVFACSPLREYIRREGNKLWSSSTPCSECHCRDTAGAHPCTNCVRRLSPSVSSLRSQQAASPRGGGGGPPSPLPRGGRTATGSSAAVVLSSSLSDHQEPPVRAGSQVSTSSGGGGPLEVASSAHSDSGASVGRRGSVDESWPSAAVRIAVMLFRTNVLALVLEKDPRCVLLWDDSKKEIISRVRTRQDVRSVKLSRDVIAIVTDSLVYVYMPDKVEPISIIHTAPNPRGLCEVSSAVDFEPWRLACPAVTSGAVRIHTAEGEARSIAFQAHVSPLAAISMSSHGTLIATASETGTVIRVFSPLNGVLLHEFRRGTQTHLVSCLAFRADDLFLAAASTSSTIHIFKLSAPRGIVGHADTIPSANSARTAAYRQSSCSPTPGSVSRVSKSNFSSTDTSALAATVSGVYSQGKEVVQDVLKEVFPRYFSAARHFAQITIPACSMDVDVRWQPSRRQLSPPRSSWPAANKAPQRRGPLAPPPDLAVSDSTCYTPPDFSRVSALASRSSPRGGQLEPLDSAQGSSSMTRQGREGGVSSTLPSSPRGGFRSTNSPAPSISSSVSSGDRAASPLLGAAQMHHPNHLPSYGSSIVGPLCAFGGEKSDLIYVLHRNGMFYEYRFETNEGGRCHLLSAWTWFAPRPDFVVQAQSSATSASPDAEENLEGDEWQFVL